MFLALEPPHPVLWASDDWLNFCGLNRAEVVGKTLSVMQGPMTDLESERAMQRTIGRGESNIIHLTSYTHRGICFSHDVNVQPLRNRAPAPHNQKHARHTHPLAFALAMLSLGAASQRSR